MKHMCIPERNSIACKVCGQPCVYPVTSSADTSPTLGDLQSPAVKRCPQCKRLYFKGDHDPETCAILPDPPAWPAVPSRDDRDDIHVSFVRCARCSHKPRAPGELDCVDCLRDAVLE